MAEYIHGRSELKAESNAAPVDVNGHVEDDCDNMPAKDEISTDSGMTQAAEPPG